MWRPNVTTFSSSQAKGEPLHTSAVRQRTLGPICERLGIAVKGPKAFRHCSAFTYGSSRHSAKVRQERLVHAPGTKVWSTHYALGSARMRARQHRRFGSMFVN
jgi:hypothetical protein